MKIGRIALFLVALLPACNGTDLVPARNKAARLAADAGWRYELGDYGTFVLATAQSPVKTRDTLTVYLEGDGMAFLGSRRVSPDPTPHNPVALKLALSQSSGAVAYVARPCQYSLPNGRGQNCDAAFWTSHRYAPEVIDSMEKAVDALKRRSGAERLILVGYSGGGAVAALLAARRSDVAGIITIAANLDVKYWTTRDHLAPLSGSLDPADFAGALKAIPQVHFVGGKDDVVPPDVAASFISKLGGGAPAQMVEIPNFSHSCCWDENWPNLMRRPELRDIIRP